MCLGNLFRPDPLIISENQLVLMNYTNVCKHILNPQVVFKTKNYIPFVRFSYEFFNTNCKLN